MKRNFPPVVFFIFIFTGLLLASCKQKPHEIVTRRIQYDVNIVSPNPNYDWWIQNIVGPQREKLVRTILKGALSGKYKAYDYFYQPLTKQEVARILTDTLPEKVRESVPPYALKDTLIISRIEIKDIRRLRFMEKWSYNPKTMQFTKTVEGIAPIARRIDAEGNTRWQPLFWIFPDKKFVRSLQQTP